MFACSGVCPVRFVAAWLPCRRSVPSVSRGDDVVRCDGCASLVAHRSSLAQSARYHPALASVRTSCVSAYLCIDVSACIE
jgi:hypothetical protein